MNTQWLGISEEKIFQIEGREHVVLLSIEYVKQAKDKCYFLSAVTETGFDLCGGSHGYFDYYCKRLKVTRLRSELSIASDMLEVLESLAAAIEKIQAEIILTERTIQAKISGTQCYAWVNGAPFFSAANIHSKSNGECISWYEHDVFNQGDIELRVYRAKDGQLRFEADENALYDKSKLRALHDSKAFQKSELAFFKYNEVRRLLGIPVKGDPKRMSGLFHHEGINE